MSAEAKPAAALTAMAGNGKGLRVRFLRDGDRYKHVVDAIVNDEVTPFLASVEGDHVQTWPPSPPLQELQVRELESGEQVIMLTGVGGHSHWSASVEVSEGIQLDSPTSGFGTRFALGTSVRAPKYLLFDVACRAKEANGFIGSTYRSVGETVSGLVDAFGFAGDGRNAFMFGPHPARLNECIVVKDRRADGNAMLCVRPQEFHITSTPITLRWKYVMIWSTI